MQKYEEYKILEIQFEEMKRDNHEKNKEVREAEELFYTLYTGFQHKKDTKMDIWSNYKV